MKTHIHLISVILLTGSTCFAGEGRSPPYDKTISEAQALDIAEVVFRYQFLNNESAQQEKAPAYFLTLFGKDPDPRFLKRFEKHRPPVQKGSAFAQGKGLEFRIERIKRISATKVKVVGGYYEGNLSASGCTYFVETKDGKWVVTSDEMRWIS
jgi:hypothetical protein